MTNAAAVAPSEDSLSARTLSKFERLLGRQPDEAEKLKLFRLKEALDLKENDEVWTFVLALQHYEFLYEKHPAEIEEALKRSVAELQVTAEKAVQVEVARVRGLLEKAVTAAASSVAAARAETSRRLARWWAGAGLAVFGGFALVCGYELGRGGLPFWMRREVALDGGAVAKVAGAILGAPAGWAALLVLLPVCIAWIRGAWPVAQDDEQSSALRAKAWATLVGAAGTWVLGAVGVAWLVGSLAAGEPEHRRAPRKTAVMAAAPSRGVAALPQRGQDPRLLRASPEPFAPR